MNNEPAFPNTLVVNGRGEMTSGWDGYGVGGMSLRDYFAAKAMEGLIEGYDFEVREKSVTKTDRTGFDDMPHPEDSDETYALSLARESYIIADAMVKARDEK